MNEALELRGQHEVDEHQCADEHVVEPGTRGLIFERLPADSRRTPGGSFSAAIRSKSSSACPSGFRQQRRRDLRRAHAVVMVQFFGATVSCSLTTFANCTRPPDPRM